ncbi:M48 family metallopeptidase [Anabaena sp. PCC 7108]|uniref:M48 family metallopeptidase n=1 Tax=Anabaena sp. PCC 7108 TaxID=163908 RepID=UPI000345D150|nr:M48 family metallopeptidase [Anabaena sp. PCC 7108]
MALNQEEFDTLVTSLQQYAQQQPGSYKLRVGLLALLGYGYIFFSLVLMLLVFVGLLALAFYTKTLNSVVLKLALVLLVPIFVVLRSLWVTFPEPQGLKLQRQEATYLFNLVDKLTTKLKSPKFHHILLTDEFNAAVVQIPRLGLLGWQQNYLLLGLPLMQALSPEQFCAVLGHELGHLSGNHSQFAGWIYRIQKTYYQILEKLQQSGDQVGSLILQSFFNWYSPFFAAYSFVLRRMNEYEADRCAAELVGVENIAEALINVDVKAKFLENSFWPSIYKQAEELVEPPQNVYEQVSLMLFSCSTQEDSIRFLQQALSEKTDHQDTHPCLQDRLESLGYLTVKNQGITVPPQFEISAASEYLGNNLEKFTHLFDQTWQEKVQTPWRQRYAYAQESLQKLQVLEEKSKNQSLTKDENWDIAYLTWEFRSQETAMLMFRAILADDENHTEANYLLGQALLKRNDDSGIDYIERAISKNSNIFIDGCNLIYVFLKSQGRNKELKSYQERIQQHYEFVWLAKQERSDVKDNDQFKHHDLSAEVIENLCSQLAKYPELKTAYLVQKVVNYFPEEHFYILGVQRKWTLTDSGKYKFLEQIINEVEFPGYTYVIIINNDTKKVEKNLRQVPEAVIYQR